MRETSPRNRLLRKKGVAPLPKSSTPVLEYPQEWNAGKITKESIKAHDRKMKRLARKALEQKGLLEEGIDCGSIPAPTQEAGNLLAVLQDAGAKPTRTHSTAEESSS